MVSGKFSDGSTSLGLLVIVYSLANDNDVRYLTILRTEKEHEVSAVFRGIPHRLLSASVFTIEDNGLPFGHVATKVKTVQINSTTNNGKS